MADSESIKKMLRSVLQSSKSGVSIGSLQSEYRTLCGEAIPLKKLGFSKLEDYLRSIPSVVRLDYRMGELKCFAAVCQETAHIAELVARQKNSKKCGPSKVINCKMRFKASNPYMLNVTPRSSLRQPSLAVASNWPANRSQTHGGYRGFSASGDYSLYDVSLVQRRITQLLEKYCSGMWMSKLPEVYSQMFKQKLHPQVLIDIEKWTHICQVEKPPSSNRADRLIYPPLPKPPTVSVKSTSSPTASPINSSTAIVPISSCPSKPEQLVAFSPSMNSAPSPPLKSSAVTASAEVRHKIKELLSKYSGGLWAHALPKLFMDTYKMPFPEHVLDNLFQLLDICTVEYPLPHDKNRVRKCLTQCQCSGHTLPSGLEVLSPVVPPCLVVPSEQYPSVLVTEAKSSNAPLFRYVGVNYSHLHEAMEDVMASFYSQSSMQHPLSNPTVGQLVAVRGEDGDDLARAQVMEIMDSNKVKVYYMDYGLSVETSGTNLLHLHQDFLSLPFQATNVRLAGLEAFSSHPSVLSSLDTLAVGKILLMETLKSCEQNEVPVAVLYDTSEEEDLNINSTCLKALQDKTMNNPLTVNVTYKDVSVTNVCADGIMYCQLPSRGNTRLKKLLEQTEVYFISQMTSDYLVARPFSGKFCLARYKGQWARVEITSMHDNRVMEIVFIDFGVPATVEVTDLREIPPLFLKDFTLIPPQAIKCRLAELTVPEGDWSQEAVLWLKEATLGSEDCKMKVIHKGDKLVYMYLFIGVDSQELHKSINHQLDRSKLFRISQHNTNKYSGKPQVRYISLSSSFFQLGQNMDVFVPVACHPGYFVLQPWQDLHKLVVLMGEMMLYYNQTGKTNTVTQIQKREVYAAKIDKNWHRVQVKAILANGLVSVYELDHGKHELVRSTLIRPLIEEFRQLPFQAIAAQLAGVAQQQWSEEASMLFRNHVEKRALVAQVESVHQMSEVKGELWACRLTVYLVDTTMEDRDLWIHSIMTDINGELSSAA
uniref:Tudor domain containing 7 a n=1 Tax=Amphiprion percula TaxID=161767 RepID=A0A3P8S344_AMPPE